MLAFFVEVSLYAGMIMTTGILVASVVVEFISS